MEVSAESVFPLEAKIGWERCFNRGENLQSCFKLKWKFIKRDIGEAFVVMISIKTFTARLP